MLRKAGLGWEFETEEVLEDFLCQYLHPLFRWTVLERQYTVNGQRCDILAVDQNQRLVIIELKNSEDRGIVQQLTRYYDALLEEQPFSQQVNYDKPVDLVAIAPSFHRDNFIDRKYHKLEFQFWQFFITSENDRFYLSLQDVDQGESSQVEIPDQEPENDDLPSPPTALLKYLTDFDQRQKETILSFRRKILRFDRRMQEIYSTGSIKYGNGTAKSSKYCAEFLLDKKYGLTLFLWLPYKGGQSQRMGRARIWTDWQDKALIEGYVSTGIGTEINKQKTIIRSLINNIKEGKDGQSSYFYRSSKHGMVTIPVSDRVMKKFIKTVSKIDQKIRNDKFMTQEEVELVLLHDDLVKEQTNVEYKLDPSPYKSLNTLLDLSLEKWLIRV
jgi:RecB family endonuclease NucS